MLATFAAVDAKEKLKPTTNEFIIHNFGSPRPGNQAFTDYIMTLFPGNAFFRVVHSSDVVPHLPMTELGFNHAGNEVWYFNRDLDLSYKICENSVGTENQTCADTVPSYDAGQHMQYVGIDLKAGWCSSDARVIYKPTPTEFLQ